ncbi:MAG: hypothetical protein HY896_04985 [Deltaproteobacteria bacterium]|nr:hypothetical protein [Deltaproteobacteria bacterium]
MKRSPRMFLSLAITLLIAAPLAAVAEEIPRYAYDKHSFELGAEISHRNYREPGVMRDKGWMYGFNGSYAYHDRKMLKFEGIANFGEVDYSGSYSDGTPVNLYGIPDYMLEARGLIGYDFPVWKTTVLTYFAGIGYRYLNDDSHAFVGGYKREANYFYSPVGFTLMTNLGNDWSVGETAELDIFWRGEQKSYLSNASPDLPDVSNSQHDGYGMRGSVSVEKKLSRISLKGTAFIRYWHIKDSDNEIREISGVTYRLWEPKNTSTEVGFVLGFKY